MLPGHYEVSSSDYGRFYSDGTAPSPLVPSATFVKSNRIRSPPAAVDAGKMTYLDFPRSRGEPTQLVAAYGGVKLDVELIDLEEWGSRKGKVAPFLPYITNPDGSILLETDAIMKHLAVLGGRWPWTTSALVTCPCTCSL